MPIITVDITKTVSTDLQAEKIFNPVHIQVILYQQGFYPDLTSYYKYKILDTLLKTYILYKFLFILNFSDKLTVLCFSYFLRYSGICNVYVHLVLLNALTTNVSLYSTINPGIKLAFPFSA